MKIAILGCERSWSVKKLEEEAKKRGHKITFIKISDLVFEIDPKLKVSINGIKDLKNFDILMRRRIVEGYLQSLVAASYMRKHNRLVIPRRVDVGQAYDDKMTQAVKLHNGGVKHLPVFQTLSRKNAIKLLNTVDYPIIIKGLIGTKGKQVFKVNSKSAALKLLKKYKYANVLIQEFVNIKHDYRVFVVGKKILGIMKRVIPEGEYRANVAQGAKTVKTKLSKRVKKIAMQAIKILKYDIAGVDVIYHKKMPAVLEVNASPGLEGFSKTTKINVAEKIIKYLEKRQRFHMKKLQKKNEKNKNNKNWLGEKVQGIIGKNKKEDK